MHEISVADGRDITWSALVEIIVSLCRRRKLVDLELIDLLVLTERKLCPLKFRVSSITDASWRKCKELLTFTKEIRLMAFRLAKR